MVALVRAHQDADPSHLVRLLRARRERPHGRRAEERYELASPHCPRPSASIALNPALNLTDYSREMRAAEWASMASLRSSNGEPDVSALGHKRTFAVQNVMSALHPIADMCGATRYVRFVPKADISEQAPKLSYLFFVGRAASPRTCRRCQDHLHYRTTWQACSGNAGGR